MKADYNLQQFYICTKLDTIRYMYLTNLPNTYLYHIKISFKGPHKSNITKSNSTKIISTKVWLKNTILYKLEHGPKTMQHGNKRKQNGNMKFPQPK